MIRGEKRNYTKKKKLIIGSIFLILSILLIISFTSAGFFDWVKKITGEATVDLNITVGGPAITNVWNQTLTSITPTEAPASTSVIINFTVYNPSGAGNLNHSTAKINISSADEDTRTNASCEHLVNWDDNYANFTCNITMWWWDGSAVWDITAYIEDNQTNSAMNTSTNFYVGLNTAFAMGPSILNWTSLSPGATNQTSNNDPLRLNNTGNKVISAGDITLNSSNLRGESTSSEALWAGNFSISWDTGNSCTGADCVECAGTVMVRNSLEGIITANLTKGNYTINDEIEGQEQLYFCLRTVGSKLSTQAYSTANETEWPWVVSIS